MINKWETIIVIGKWVKSLLLHRAYHCTRCQAPQQNCCCSTTQQAEKMTLQREGCNAKLKPLNKTSVYQPDTFWLQQGITFSYYQRVLFRMVIFNLRFKNFKGKYCVFFLTLSWYISLLKHMVVDGLFRTLQIRGIHYTLPFCYTFKKRKS